MHKIVKPHSYKIVDNRVFLWSAKTCSPVASYTFIVYNTFCGYFKKRTTTCAFIWSLVILYFPTNWWKRYNAATILNVSSISNNHIYLYSEKMHRNFNAGIWHSTHEDTQEIKTRPPITTVDPSQNIVLIDIILHVSACWKVSCSKYHSTCSNVITWSADCSLHFVYCSHVRDITYHNISVNVLLRIWIPTDKSMH